jgi:hypothetical protein
MKEYRVSAKWSQSIGIAFLLAIFLFGCGRQQTFGPAAPAVMSAVPANGATGVPMAQVISASFNEAMNAATITASTFMVAGPGGVPVTGTVT